MIRCVKFCSDHGSFILMDICIKNVTMSIPFASYRLLQTMLVTMLEILLEWGQISLAPMLSLHVLL